MEMFRRDKQKDVDMTRKDTGLTHLEAAKRLEQYGANTLAQGKKSSALKIFAAQFRDVLMLILLASTVLSVMMGEISEALTIIAIVFLNAVLGFVQEFRTERTLDALKNMAAPACEVLREGKRQQIPAAEVVPGDVLFVEAGGKVAADAILVETVELHTDESILSGESLPVAKLASTSFQCSDEANRPDMVYMGSTVTQGRGRAIVCKTGMDTQMGQVAGMLDNIEEEQTPLQRRLDQMGKYIAIGCLVICAVVSVTGILRGEPAFDMLLTGISLSVAAVPEGLPAIVTIALALAVSRMVKRHALIRRLHAVETLGCASVICSDKTGTLTENRMTVKRVVTPVREYEVTGSGNEKAGDFLSRGERVLAPEQSDLKLLLDIGAICTNAELSDASEKKRNRSAPNTAPGELAITGEPTETAILAACYKGGSLWSELARTYAKTDEIPFDSDRKCMSVVVSQRNGEKRVMTKGAVDVILKKCRYIQTRDGVILLTEGMKAQILDKNDALAKDALRVLGFAYRDLRTAEDKKTLESNLVFAGMMGMIDPPRKEVYSAVKTCRRAGIKPVMITGDHKVTACAIAKEIGILHHGDLVMTGEEIDRMSEEAFQKTVKKVSVFARVSPKHKLKIVRAFKKAGHIVAMTGDGVNDAPAIKEADIGVSMGIGGTDVTKEASSIILLDDNFATLVSAIEEGRVIYANIRKFIRYLLSCNIGEVCTMFVGMLMGLPVILLPIQILLVNLVTDGLPAIALGLEPAEDDVMKYRPRGKNEGVFSHGLATTIVFRGFLIGLSTLAVFTVLYNLNGSLVAARSGALLTLVLTQLVHVFECKSEKHTLFRIPLFNNWKLIGAVLISGAMIFATIYCAPLQALFQTCALSAKELLIAIGITFTGPVLSTIVFGFRKKPDLVVVPEEDETQHM